jgi:hypothetical protein
MDHLHTSRSVISRMKKDNRIQLSTQEAEHVMDLKSIVSLVWDVSITEEKDLLDISKQTEGDLSIRRRYRHQMQRNTFAPLVSGSPSNQKKSYQMPINLVASSGKNNTQVRS